MKAGKLFQTNAAQSRVECFVGINAERPLSFAISSLVAPTADPHALSHMS